MVNSTNKIVWLYTTDMHKHTENIINELVVNTHAKTKNKKTTIFILSRKNLFFRNNYKLKEKNYTSILVFSHILYLQKGYYPGWASQTNRIECD